MSFARKVLIGLVGGVLTGLFLGDYAGIFRWPADGFIRLLQTTVFPYIVISIVNNLGRLEPQQARSLALRVGAVLLGLWSIAILLAFLIPLSFPESETASFFSTTLLQAPEPFDFIGLYVPSNPFHALANSVVPAIVLFSILMGVALMRTDRKAAVLDMLAVAEAAIARATRMITQLTPYGLFAIAANAAGTLNIAQFSQIQLYLIAYTAVSGLLGLWILPGLVQALTPVRAFEMLRRNRESLITAATAGDVFIVLPALIETSKELLREHDRDARTPDLPEVIVPTAYNLPHSGKLLSLSFILFAGWYSDSPLGLTQLPRLAVTGVLTMFGSINGAVPFLLDAFKVPADTFQLFVAMSVVNARVGSFVAGVHTLAVAIIGAAAVVGHLRLDTRRLLRFAIESVIATAIVIGGLRLLFATVLHQPYIKNQVIMTMQLLDPPVPAVVLDQAPAPAAEDQAGSVLDAINRRGQLRVCFTRDAMPFAFTNARGQFVGHDVDLAHLLARELGVTLEFVPVTLPTFAALMQNDVCDLVMSGLPVTTKLASTTLFSNAYLNETLAFVVPDPARHKYETWDSIRRLNPLSVSVIALPYYLDKVRMLLPEARLVPVATVSELFKYKELGVDAALLTAERGSTWTLLHPELSVVVPQPDPIRVPLAFAVARHDVALATFVNSWIDLKKQDGTLDMLYRHWILGADAVRPVPRWSIMRNVLHWAR
jgi:Na+/H+-dicarboxylate symporter/ABC-type amino acid transport substrate-binding protein